MTTTGASGYPVPWNTQVFGIRVPAIGIILVGGLVLRLVVAFILVPGQGFQDDLRMFENWANT